MDRFVSKIAFYVTRRKPKELMDLPSSTFDELLRFLPGKRRVSAFGSWRRRRKQAVQPSGQNPPGEGEAK